MTEMSAFRNLRPGVGEPAHTAKGVVAQALIENRAMFLRVLTRELRNKDHAEDVFHDVCERALNTASSLRAETSVVPWLNRILRSTLKDVLRQDVNRRSRDAEYARLQDIHTDSPDELSLESICCCFRQALPKLACGYGELVKRVDLAGHDRSAVAKQLGLTSNSLAVRLHRARQALKRALLRMCSTCPEHGFLKCGCEIAQNQARPARGLVS